MMYDLIALAYQANLTRVASMMVAAEVSNQPYTFIGVNDAFHPLSHHANDAAKMVRLAKVQAFKHLGVRQVHQAPRGASGRGGHDAGQFDHSVRQQHEQQQPA